MATAEKAFKIQRLLQPLQRERSRIKLVKSALIATAINSPIQAGHLSTTSGAVAPRGSAVMGETDRISTTPNSRAKREGNNRFALEPQFARDDFTVEALRAPAEPDAHGHAHCGISVGLPRGVAKWIQASLAALRVHEVLEAYNRLASALIDANFLPEPEAETAPSTAERKPLPRAREPELCKFLKTIKPINEKADRTAAEEHFRARIPREQFRKARTLAGVKGLPGRPRKDH